LSIVQVGQQLYKRNKKQNIKDKENDGRTKRQLARGNKEKGRGKGKKTTGGRPRKKPGNSSIKRNFGEGLRATERLAHAIEKPYEKVLGEPMKEKRGKIQPTTHRRGLKDRRA